MRSTFSTTFPRALGVRPWPGLPASWPPRARPREYSRERGRGPKLRPASVNFCADEETMVDLGANPPDVRPILTAVPMSWFSVLFLWASWVAPSATRTSPRARDVSPPEFLAPIELIHPSRGQSIAYDRRPAPPVVVFRTGDDGVPCLAQTTGFVSSHSTSSSPNIRGPAGGLLPVATAAVALGASSDVPSLPSPHRPSCSAPKIAVFFRGSPN